MQIFISTAISRTVLGLIVGLACLSAAVNTALAHRIHTNAEDCAPDVECSPVQPHPEEVIAFWERDDNLAKAEIIFQNGPERPPPQSPITPESDEFGYAQMATPYQNEITSRVTGMLVKTDSHGNGPTHCTASIIHSVSGNLLITARHCVEDASGWVGNMLFVPAYNGKEQGKERMPFGMWVVAQIFMPKEWANDGSKDLAVLRVYPNSAGQRIEQAVGGHLIPKLNTDEEFGAAIDIGYPGTAPYTPDHSGKQFYCLTHATRDVRAPDMLFMQNCSATHGDSGGPIVVYSEPGSPHAPQADAAPHVIAVINSNRLARLRPTVFCPLYQAAESSTGASPDLDSCNSTQH